MGPRVSMIFVVVFILPHTMEKFDAVMNNHDQFNYLPIAYIGILFISNDFFEDCYLFNTSIH